MSMQNRCPLCAAPKQPRDALCQVCRSKMMRHQPRPPRNYMPGPLMQAILIGLIVGCAAAWAVLHLRVQ